MKKREKRLVFRLSVMLIFAILCAIGAYAADIVTIDDAVTSSPSIVSVDANTIYITYLYPTPGVSSYELKFARSLNGGQTWDHKVLASGLAFTSVPSLQAVNKNIIFVSYYEPSSSSLALLKSTDGGQIWATSSIRTIQISSRSRSSLYALDSNNIFLAYRPYVSSGTVSSTIQFANSLDGGQTWAVLSTIDNTIMQPPEGSIDFALYALDSSTFFVVYWKKKNDYDRMSMLARSTDRGRSWQLHEIALGNAVPLLFSYELPIISPSLQVVDKDILFVAQHYQYDFPKNTIRVAKSTNGGDTWNVVKEFDQSIDPTQFSGYPFIHAVGERLVIVLFSNADGLHMTRSRDGGSTWDLPNNIGNLGPGIVDTFARAHIAADALHANRLAIAYGNDFRETAQFLFAAVDTGFKELCLGTLNSHTLPGASPWQEILVETNPCCGDEPERDRGFVGSDPVYGKDSFLCYEEKGFWGWLPAGQFKWEVKDIGNKDAVSNSQEWLVCDSNHPGMSVPFPSSSDTDSTRARAKKFYCENRGNNYRFTECCVPGVGVTDDRKCENNPPEVQMFPGQPTTLLFKDVKKTFTQSDYIELTLKESGASVTDDWSAEDWSAHFNIADWSMYSRLDIVYKVSENFDIYLEVYDQNNINVLPVKLSYYAVNTPLLNKWTHAQIPISGLDNIKKIRFRFDAHLRPGETISNKLDIQQASLVPALHQQVGSTLISNAGELTFCSANKYLKDYSEDVWITDLDSTAMGAGQNPIPAGKSACDAIGGLNWTGSQCCGDDNRRFSTEYYRDADGACWNGNYINESTAMGVAIDFTSPIGSAVASPVRVNYFCPYNQCSYPSPSDASYTITNGGRGTYNISFYNYSDGKYSDASTSSLPVDNEDGYITAMNVPQEILYTDGALFACNPSPATLQRRTLFSSVSTCNAKGNYFCSPMLGWSNAVSSYPGLTLQPQERNTQKSSSPLGINSASCCSTTSCWNGTVCVADQSPIADPNDPNAEIYGDARCVAGNWVVTRKVFTWDKKESGYCSVPSQCLVDFDGNASANNQPLEYYKRNSPLCIDDSQYILDNYCSSGEWTTRTKLIALELLDYVLTVKPVNYTLFCDEPAAALVDVDYSNVQDYINGTSAAAGFGVNALRTCFAGSALPCVNNFCVLDYTTRAGDKKKAFGVSLNKDISSTSSFLKAIGLSEQYCNALQGTERYRKCSGDSKIWFNSSLNSLIYSSNGINLDKTLPLENVGKWFSNLYYELIHWLLGRPAPPSADADYSFTTNTSRFNKLYIDSRPGSTIYGFQEEIGENVFMLINYKGFQTDICAYVNSRLSIPVTGSTPAGVVCEADATNTRVYTNDVVAAALWQDFTSALRVS
ncbi:exo-alpha-sialidase [Candidatus Woesearchaeota archaeon]|nr:exo-alpha-sialidase [Candidatus Woesearchaeota archaeon]